MYTGSVAKNTQKPSLLPPRVDPPSRRHGTPSGPWPFLDIDDEVDPARIEDPDSHLPMSASPCEHKQMPDQYFCWCKYPQSMYPNWALRQQKKSKIHNFAEKRKGNCKLFYLDVMENGLFINPLTMPREINNKTQDSQWVAIKEGRPKGVLVRGLFVENLNGITLRMLGTRYNIEPFFFSSTIGWIPSRYQSHLVPKTSDHITITLTFIHSINNPTIDVTNPQLSNSDVASVHERPKMADLIIDTQSPLPLRSGDSILLPDLLAVHMVRSPTGNTIISLHPGLEHRGTSAENLHLRVHLTGRSVYWSNIFKDCPDPTFVFLSVLWYALYAWDEALENLYNHICFLESDVMTTHDFEMSNELHVIRAHLLHYESLLEDFKNTVLFVRDTPNPALLPSDDPDADHDFEKVKRHSAMIMKRECNNLLSEIQRLEESRNLQTKRLKNVMDLGFSKVTIEESRSTKRMTEASVKDSAAMKQIAYLTMAFLPASFVAAMFGMNVKELTGDPKSPTNIPHYVAAAISLTIVTIWIIIAYQIQITEPRTKPEENECIGSPDLGKKASRYHFYGFGPSGGNDATERRLDIWGRLWWPYILLSFALDKMKQRKERSAKTRIESI